MYVHGLGSASAVYNAHIAARPELAGRRSLFVDLPGHGISDRPVDFGYTLEDHADALAAALDEARVTAAELVAHSMGGAVAIVLADRRPTSCPGSSSWKRISTRTPRARRAAAGSPPTRSGSTSKTAATRACSTRSAPHGPPPCDSPTRSPSTGPRPGSRAAPRPPCATCWSGRRWPVSTSKGN
ncbi:alpha/beta fold hydrolase [Streptomyces kaempferi]